MKIVFTGGGTGGHFYPIIAVAEAVNAIVEKEKLTAISMYYFSDAEYDKKSLLEQSVQFRYIPAGKLRLYFSLQNFTDAFKTLAGIAKAVFALFSVYPDVVFAKGGYASFPTLVAARLLRIPVIVHESDSVPGRVTKWASRFAYRVAVSYPEAARFFPSTKVAHTGQPIRKGIAEPTTVGAYEFLGIEQGIPTLFIIGGSLGAQIINNAILEALPQLVRDYQIIHQVGEKNLDAVRLQADAVLTDTNTHYRYKVFGFLNPLAMKMSAGVADVVISRAGSALFEIARWKKPSIIIPITVSHGDHQRQNAFNYARAGAGIVIEEANLKSGILLQEIKRIIENEELQSEMKANAEAFSGGDAAHTIAQELVTLAIEHNS